jgi:DNA-binding transcriptional regulator LsrR (DeoR family)
LRQIPNLALAAGGLPKAPIIRAAILAGLCQVLITDEAAAEELLKLGFSARTSNPAEAEVNRTSFS